MFFSFEKKDLKDNSREYDTLLINGVIAQESWWGDETTPAMFREELQKAEGDLTVVINSPGGDVFAGVEIYNALKEFKGNVTVRVEGLCASIATVIAMAGDKIIMSPGSLFMIHDPMGGIYGGVDEMQKAIEILNSIKDSVVPIYTERTGLSEKEIVDLMTEETWMTAEEALEYGFIDEAEKAKSKAKKSLDITNLFSNRFALSMKASKEAVEAAALSFKNKMEGNTMEDKDEIKGDEATVAETPETEADNTSDKAEDTEADETTETVDKDKEETETTDAAEDDKDAETKQKPEETAVDDKAVVNNIESLVKELAESKAALAAKDAELLAEKKARDEAEAKYVNANNAYAKALGMVELAEKNEPSAAQEPETLVGLYEKYS